MEDTGVFLTEDIDSGLKMSMANGKDQLSASLLLRVIIIPSVGLVDNEVLLWLET